MRANGKKPKSRAGYLRKWRSGAIEGTKPWRDRLAVVEMRKSAAKPGDLEVAEQESERRRDSSAAKRTNPTRIVDAAHWTGAVPGSKPPDDGVERTEAELLEDAKRRPPDLIDRMAAGDPAAPPVEPSALATMLPLILTAMFGAFARDDDVLAFIEQFVPRDVMDAKDKDGLSPIDNGIAEYHKLAATVCARHLGAVNIPYADEAIVFGGAAMGGWFAWRRRQLDAEKKTDKSKVVDATSTPASTPASTQAEDDAPAGFSKRVDERANGKAELWAA